RALYFLDHTLCTSPSLRAPAIFRPEKSQMIIASAIRPTRPASPSDLTSAMMFVTTSPKNGRFTPTRSAATIASANSKSPISVSAAIQFLTVSNMCVSALKFFEQSARSQLKHPIYRYAKLRHGPTETQGGQVALKLKSGDNSFDRLPGLGQLSTAIGL